MSKRTKRGHETRRALIAPGPETAVVRLNGHETTLTNLHKPFWTSPLITKRDLLNYYGAVSPWLLPHLRDRAMVMKRYPNGAAGEFFFMKRAPTPRPEWLQLCSIEHASDNVIDFPVVQDLLSLLWLVNLGCIDLNPWYARCDGVHQPDVLHFDLDPTPGATFTHVREAALLVHRALDQLDMVNVAKTTGSRGIHVYVPIKRGPDQKEVWQFAVSFARTLAEVQGALITAEYSKAKRPRNHVLVDYNQNAWGRTLASVYSVRPQARAPVSAPVTWTEVENGIEIDDFRLDNMPARLDAVGDLWQPLLASHRRVNLAKLMGAASRS